MNMKKKWCYLSLCLLCCVWLTAGCGSGGGDNAASFKAESEHYDSSQNAYGGDPAAVGIDGEAGSSSSSASTEDSAKAPADQTQAEAPANTAADVSTDMLVYTCSLSIDTLNYDQSVSTFKNMLSAAGGFVEHENYSDGQSASSYYIEENDKDKRYTATVRVPHDKYDEFLNGADQLGDVRSKSSSVENLGQEYSDLNTSLSIYEAKEKRYIKMLSTITDDEQAVRVEKELTELQIKIASIKTRMTNIRTDVNYSTIDISIHEVSKYDETPKPTDTFSQRLGNTVKDTWKNFLVFLEVMLFFLIRVMPYAIIIGIIILIICLIAKKRNSGQKSATMGNPAFPKKDDSPEKNEFPKKDDSPEP